MKTQLEALDLLKSKTIDAPGSDDLSQTFSFIVGKETGEFVPPETSVTAEQLTNIVAKGDSYRISGTCYGSNFVSIVTISPKGGGGNATDGAKPGFIIYTLPLENQHFSKRIPVDKYADSGVCAVLILSPGRNGIYDGIGTEDLKNGLNEKYTDLTGMTQAQLVWVIQGATIEAAGSDDLAQELRFKIESPYVNLKSIGDVQIGITEYEVSVSKTDDTLEINGTTNREPGTRIIISCEGPTDLPMAIADVEWPTPDEGVFTAAIDTYEAVIGTYTIEADDGEGYATDTVILKIVATLPTPTITHTPKLTPTPTPAVTITPTPVTPSPSPSPTPSTPGFVAVFAIAGLAVAYILKRYRRL